MSDNGPFDLTPAERAWVDRQLASAPPVSEETRRNIADLLARQAARRDARSSVDPVQEPPAM